MTDNNKNYFIGSLHFVYVVLIFLSLPPVYAALDSWSPSSPTGGIIQSLAVDPNTADTLFAGTSHGVYKSTDGGNTWTFSSTGLNFLDVQVVAIDPNDPNHILTGTNGGGIYRSRDAGASWTAVNDTAGGLINLNVHAIIFDPNDADNMYAGTFGNVFSSGDRTSDTVTWEAQGISTGLNHNAVQTLAANPGTPGLFYLGTFSGGAFASSNSTTSWSVTNAGFISLNIKHLSVSSTGNLYAGTQGSGFFIGTPVTPTIIAWSESNTGIIADATINSVVESASDPNTLYAATHNNVYRSTDGGANWSTLGTSLSGVRVLSLAIDYNTLPNETIYAGTTQGVYKLTSGSSTWNQANTGMTAVDVTDIAIDPNNPLLHYAATRGSGIFTSSDGGNTWNHANNGLNDLHIQSIALDGSNIYIGTQFAGTHRSLDGGNTWTSVNGGLGTNHTSFLADDPSSSDVLYAATPAGVSISSNGGGVWIGINGDIANNHDLKVQSLAIDSANIANRRIYISTSSSGVFYSPLSSIAWTNISLGLENKFIYAIAIDPNNTNTLYAGTRGNGAYKSIDRGASWFAINTGIRATDQDIIHVNTLAIDPNNSNIVYAGTETRGVYRSVNGGDSWTQSNDGLENLNINILKIDPSTSRVFVGTNGSGISEIDYSTPSSASLPQEFQSDKQSSGGSGLSDYLILFILSLLSLIRLNRR